MITNTLLGRDPIREISLMECLAVAGLASLAAAAVALCLPQERARALLVFTALICGYAGVAFWIFRSSRTMIAVAGPELTILLSMLAALGLRSALSPYPVVEP